MKYNVLFCLLLLSSWSIAQANTLFGTLTNTAGEELPFAVIYIVGTSSGTTTNAEGYYELELEAGNYEIAFQYLGYTTKKQKIALTQKRQKFDVQLEPMATSTREIVVTAGEDPAYAIIRKAIRKRKYYEKQFDAFSCNSYVKGTQYVENLPKSFMGQSLEDVIPGLDSNGTGVIYLSESVSRLYFKKGEYKEVMTSSKISGDDNGFSFNSGAAMADISFYNNNFELGGSKILSPIAGGALGSYDYQLLNDFEDADGRIIYGIKVIPKNDLSATFRGMIYIVDQDWAIYSTELYTTGKAINIAVLDTVLFKQTHINLGGDKWRVFSQDITFGLNLLFIKTRGRFIGVFSDYNLKPNFEKGFFNAEIFKVEDEANKKMETFWDSIRPVPLLQTEAVEYHTKDSLAKIWATKAYQDSVDKKNNEPTLLNLIGGYTYQNTYENWNIKILSPIDKLTFSTVQGQLIGLGAEFFKGLDKEKNRWYRLHADAEYGFEDKQVRFRGFAQMKFNSITHNLLHLEGGRQLRQFNINDPVSMLVNTYYSLIFRQNYAKFYDEAYGRIYYSQYLTHGLLMRAGAKYAVRSAVVNHTDFSWLGRKSGKDMFSNHPLDFSRPPLPASPSFETNSLLEFTIALRIRFGEKYVSYPKRRFYTSSNSPDIWIKYKKAIGLQGAETNYDYLSLQITKEDISLGVAGLFSYNIEGGWFIQKTNEMQFMDYHHFSGNQTIISAPAGFLNSFQLLPYYEYSTNTHFAAAHLEHKFNGFLWNKIPGLKKLGFEVVAGGHFLYTPEQKPYAEFNIGLDRIGWKLFRVLRADFVMGYRPNEALRVGGVLTFNFSL